MTRFKPPNRPPSKRPRSRSLIGIAAATVVGGLILAYGLWFGDSPAINQITGQAVPSDTPPQSVAGQPGLDKTKYPLTDPASPWVVVNKGRKLPSGYRPADLVVPKVTLRYSAGGSEMQLRAEAAQALQKMFSGGQNEGLKLMLASGFRSYSTQGAVYGRHVRDYGQAAADKVSARPGHSEHQTGWAVDVAPASGKCLVAECFGDLAEGRWVAANAAKYGFIIRYPAGMESLTGYAYEPWHLRYVGTELAAELSNSGQTLERYFGLPVVDGYPAEILQL